MSRKLASIRSEYKKSKLSAAKVSKDPFEMFTIWMNEALESKIQEPTAFTISTVSDSGQPSNRTVLLKGYENNQFTFFTNYNSRKGMQLSANPKIGALIYWKELERQVIIEGTAVKTTNEESDLYFKSRPWKSKIGARISPQSEKVKSRTVIKMAFAKEAAKYLGREVPRPDYWGGYHIIPERIEFWQGRANRLHDRVVYELENNKWNIARLAP